MQKTDNSSTSRQRLLQRYLSKERLADAPRIVADRSSAVAPLSFGQEQIWLHLRVAPGSAAYNEAVILHHKGELDPEILGRTLSEVVRRHEAWRSTFCETNGELIQTVHPPQAIALPLVDFRDVPQDERENRVLELFTAEAQRPYDISAGPLLRPLLVRLEDRDFRLLLAMHHMIFDGVSIYRVLIPELVTIYAEFERGLPSPLPDLPIQYSDFARWQRLTLTSNPPSRALEYWRQKLTGATAGLQLPGDRPRAAVQTFRGSSYKFTLPANLSAGLKDLSRREGATLFITLLAAFKVLLLRYTGEEDILVGGVTAGRNRSELEGLIGFFLNTIVLRTDLSGDPTFRELLSRVKRTVLEALEHDEVPFEVLVKELGPQRDPQTNPYFQILFSIEPPFAATESEWELSQGEIDTGATKFDLDFQLDERQDSIVGHCSYSTDLFDETTLVAMIEHWQNLLRHAVDDPGRKISSMSLLGPEEALLPRDVQDMPQPRFPRSSCIHQLFEEQVDRSPDQVALVCGKERITYRELERRANCVANNLRRAGVQADTVVGLLVERSVGMMVGLIAILKAGGAYLPLESDIPAQRLSTLLRDADLRFLVTNSALLPFLPANGQTKVFCLDTDSMIDADASRINNAVSPENLAYVMYTSGSTGAPKGVEIEHRSIVNLVRAASSLAVDDRPVTLQMAPLSFDASTWEIWLALARGGTCILYPGKVPIAAKLGEIIRIEQVQTLWLTSSLFNVLIDEGPEVLMPVRTLFVGGEALSVSHVRRATLLLPTTQIINGYGPTEATTFSCWYHIPVDMEADATSVPIGRAIPNVSVYVVGDSLQPCPTGVPGEICIGGAGLARGYRGRPDLTADLFVDTRLGRLYRTGDRGRYRSDGNIEYLGRFDQQVKIRGFRVELGEIEATLQQHPDVRAAVVVADQSLNSKRLVAHVEMKSNSSCAPSELIVFLRQRLPEYMLPSQIVCVASLSRLANGKIDRQALQAVPTQSSTGGSRPFVPSGELEIRLAEIWEAVLQTKPIQADVSFFEQGGHSLLALSLIHRMERIFEREFSWPALMRTPTIEKMAEVVRATECCAETENFSFIADDRGCVLRRS